MTQLELAMKYRESGLQVLALRENSKEPLEPWKEYQQRPLTDSELFERFKDDRKNIGILCGPISNNLLVIDFDSKRAFEEYRRDLEPLLNRSLVTKTRRGVHLYARTDAPLNAGTFESVKEIDFKYRGYVVAPESQIDGFQYQFFNDTEIVKITPEQLPFKLNKRNPSSAEISQARRNISIGYGRPYGISEKFFKALKGQHDLTRYESRSEAEQALITVCICLLYTSPSPRDRTRSRMPSSA